MSNYIVNDTSLTFIANAIRTKGGTSEPLEFPDGFVTAIGEISGGGGRVSVPSKDVDFIDYDGAIVYSYTAEGFLALSAMPENPDHSGDEVPLTAQGWNWTLADAQEYVAKYGTLDVGQMYVPTDGKTHIGVYVDRERPASLRRIILRFSQENSNGTRVDWGDGSTKETYSGTAAANYEHIYSKPGNYDITLEALNGRHTVEYTTASISSSEYNTRDQIVYARIGENTIVGTGMFRKCKSIRSITIPSSCDSIGSAAFNEIYAIKSVIIPANVANLGVNDSRAAYCYGLERMIFPARIIRIPGSMFYEGACLKTAHLPPQIIAIGSSSFYNCKSLSSVWVPETVTSIGAQAFYGASNVLEYHMLPTNPPSLASTNVFNGMASDCIIYVPRGRLATYKSATNWSTYASKMQEEPQ